MAEKYPNEASTTPDRFMRLPEVIANTGLKKATIYKRLKLKAFPPSFPLGGGIVAWSATEIAAWIEAQKAQRKPVA